MLIVVLAGLICYSDTKAQLSITSTATPFTIDFDNAVAGVNNGQFTGTGFSPTPVVGQINSNAFSITGLSDGTLNFGGTGTTGDFARGTSTGGVTTGGIYAFNVGGGNHTLGFQPTNADMTPGDFILKIQNNSGVAATSILITYDIWYLNNTSQSNSFNVSYSTDGTSFTSGPINLNFISPPAADGLGWNSATRLLSVDLSGSPIANGNYFYVKWTTNGGLGSGDELAIDDISATINPPVDSDSRISDIGEQPETTSIPSIIDSEGEALEALYFQIEDLATNDFLPTNVKSLRFVPGPNNTASWTTQIQGVTIWDGVTFYSIESKLINDSYIDINFTSGDLIINDGESLTLGLLVYLKASTIIDGGVLEFQIDTDPIGFSTYAGGSGFATSFPAVITSNALPITVDATELRFLGQPVNANTNINMATNVSIEATDVNGNRDLDFVNSIDLSSSGTMTGEPISVAAVAGLASWPESTNPIIHTVGGTGLLLTGSSVGWTDATSNPFDILQSADHVVFTSYPTQGQRNQIVAPIVVSALKPDLSVDTNFTGNITLSVNSGLGLITGTLTKAAVAGVATFSDIQFSLNGDYTLLATGAPYMTTATSETIQISPFFQGFTTCPPAGWLSVGISGNGWVCGSGYAAVSGIGGALPTEAWYIMPSINFSTLSNEVLSFDSWTSGTDTGHPRLEVLYSTNYSGSGNPNIATWNPLTYSPPSENAQVWAPSGLIDLSAIASSAHIAFKYTSSGTGVGSATEWRIDNVAITENGCTTPSVQASNLTFSDIQSTQMTLNWVNGNGTGRIVIAKAISSPSETPVNGTNYTANTVFGTPGTEIGTSFIVYKGNGNSATITNLTPNVAYYFTIYEFNCNAANPTFNITNPAAGSQQTIDPNASDIIVNALFTYPVNIDYKPYQAPVRTMSTANSLTVFGLTIRDGGVSANSDGQSTTLTSISFNANGSRAIRAAALYYSGAFIATVNSNGSLNDFTFDISASPIEVPDLGAAGFELYVTFMAGDNIIDNEQVVFTVTAATANPSGTLFSLPNAGGATSIGTGGNENKIRVEANDVRFVQVPLFSIPLNEEFTIEAEASDALGTRDRDKTLTIVVISPGTGALSAVSGLTKSTADSTVVWTDLIYDTQQDTRFRITAAEDPVNLRATTGTLSTKPRMTIYTFTGAAGDETTLPPDKQPLNGAVSHISRGANIIPVTRANTFNARSWPTGGIDLTGSYYEFTVTSIPGFSFDIGSIEFDHRRSLTGPLDWQIRNSTDGFTSSFGKTMADVNTWIRNENVNLTITAEDTVTFRLYGFTAEAGNGNWALDNIEIFGTFYDTQAPSFTATYPKYDSVAVNGFDLLINIDEPATVYYVVQDPALVLTAPDLNEVISGLNGDGNPAAATDALNVIFATTNFFERVTGLNAETLYNVYYVLYDGTNYSGVIPQLGIRTSDTDSDLTSATQPGGTTISSLADSINNAVPVFSFNISDLGTNDGAPTHVTKLVFNAVTGNTVADWQTTIGGISLYNDTESSTYPDIQSNYNRHFSDS